MSMINPEFDVKSIELLNRVGKPGFAKKMASMFERSAPAKVSVITLALQSGDRTAISDAAHSLKSSAGQMGAISLQAVAEKIETAAESSEMNALAPLVESLKAELNAALEWLSAVTDSGESVSLNPE